MQCLPKGPLYAQHCLHFTGCEISGSGLGGVQPQSLTMETFCCSHICNVIRQMSLAASFWPCAECGTWCCRSCPRNKIKQVQSDSCKIRSPKLTSHSGFRKAIKINSHPQSINSHKRPCRWPCPSIIHLLLKSSCNVKSLQPRGDWRGDHSFHAVIATFWFN